MSSSGRSAAPASCSTRIAQFQQLFAPDAEVDVRKLKQLCFQGCPDVEGIRATCWMLLLGYLPPKVSDWDRVLQEQRAAYLRLRQEVLSSPHLAEQSDTGEMVDHPLNPDPASTWHRYFEDNDLLLQIDHDTRRLYPDMSFFQLPTPFPQTQFNTGTILNIDALKKRVDRSSLPAQLIATSRGGIKNVSTQRRFVDTSAYLALKEGEEAHWEVVERVLFLYSKTNTGIGYVQGMNEIIGPLYYVFAQHPERSWRAHAEADAFFCFTALMTEIGDKFTKKLDSSQAGIGGSLQKLMVVLQTTDAVLHSHLVKMGMDAAFFGFRWITLLLSQEFLLPDVIRIWDSLFSDEKRFSFLICFCAAMMICIREQLLEADFSACMQLLQHYPITDTQKLLQKALDIRLSKR